MINRKRKNNNITKPIIGVVPHPGATFPYSELRGLNSSPNLVLSAIVILSNEIFLFLHWQDINIMLIHTVPLKLNVNFFHDSTNIKVYIADKFFSP